MHQGRKYKLFNRNIIQKVHSHLIAIPKADIGKTSRCIENVRIFFSFCVLLIGSGHPISLWFVFSLRSHCEKKPL